MAGSSTGFTFTVSGFYNFQSTFFFFYKGANEFSFLKPVCVLLCLSSYKSCFFTKQYVSLFILVLVCIHGAGLE